MKIGIFVVAHDGLQSILTGVGVVVNSFIEGFSQIKEQVSLLNNNSTELICIAPYLNKKSNDFQECIRIQVEECCKKNNGKIIEIETLSDGSSQRSVWGGQIQWKKASLNAARTIKSMEKDYDCIYIFAHDTIFSLIRYYLPKSNKTHVIWIPHSLGKLFQDEHSGDKRIILENKAIASILKNPGDFIAYIGESMKNILEKEYKVPTKVLIPLINGLSLNSNRYLITKSDIERIINKYDIPKDKKMIFAWGRCVKQKGFDIIIPAYQQFIKRSPEHHLVLLMPIETSNDEYVKKIKEKLRRIPQNKVTAIFKFDPKLPACILTSPNTDMIIFASRFEGNPITPLEALFLCNASVKLLYSNIAPLRNLLKDNAQAICFEMNSESLVKKMEQPLPKKNNKKSLDSIDILRNYSQSLTSLLKS